MHTDVCLELYNIHQCLLFLIPKFLNDNFTVCNSALVYYSHSYEQFSVWAWQRTSVYFIWMVVFYSAIKMISSYCDVLVEIISFIVIHLLDATDSFVRLFIFAATLARVSSLRILHRDVQIMFFFIQFNSVEISDRFVSLIKFLFYNFYLCNVHVCRCNTIFAMCTYVYDVRKVLIVSDFVTYLTGNSTIASDHSL